MNDYTPGAQDDPLKCHVGDWIPRSAPTVSQWNTGKRIYWYLVGGFVRRRMNEGAGPVNPAIPWGFELKNDPAAGEVWVRSC